MKLHGKRLFLVTTVRVNSVQRCRSGLGTSVRSVSDASSWAHAHVTVRCETMVSWMYFRIPVVRALCRWRALVDVVQVRILGREHRVPHGTVHGMRPCMRHAHLPPERDLKKAATGFDLSSASSFSIIADAATYFSYSRLARSMYAADSARALSVICALRLILFC